jgi:hypothetical protein
MFLEVAVLEQGRKARRETPASMPRILLAGTSQLHQDQQTSILQPAR